MSHAELSADRLIDDLGIADRSDLLLLDEIAWMRGVLVNEGLLEGSEARLIIARGQGILTVSSAIQDPLRKRFSIAHELGHFEMHRAQRGLSLCLSKEIQEAVGKHTGQDLEQEANEFASALLLPSRFLAPLCIKKGPSLDFIAELANAFSTSLIATALRYLQFSDEPVSVVFSQGNRIKWFQGSKAFDELREELGFFIDIHARLDPITLAAALFQGRKLPAKKKTQASAWFTPGRYRDDATVVEYSVSMPTYDAVLTLLWIDEEFESVEEIEDDDELYLKD